MNPRSKVRAMRDCRGFIRRMVRPLLLAAALGGCAFGGANQSAQLPPQDPQAQRNVAAAQAAERAPQRPPINTSHNLYEGSLWRGASSWGNLLRDHRARYKGDLLTVSDLQKIIKVPEIKPEQKLLPGQAAPAVQPGAQPGGPSPVQQAAQAVNQAEAAVIDPVLAFLRTQEKRRQEIEREQNEILRSIESIEVEVVRVLPNGNLLVRGVHPPIFRDGDRVKYVVTLQGIVRPSDVDENNNVLSTRISKADVKIRRFVRRDTVPFGDVARAGGQPQQGELLDRVTNFLTAPGTGSRTTPVSPR
jgi:flagellar basal body L-ring protein FlgH